MHLVPPTVLLRRGPLTTQPHRVGRQAATAWEGHHIGDAAGRWRSSTAIDQTTRGEARQSRRRVLERPFGPVPPRGRSNHGGGNRTLRPQDPEGAGGQGGPHPLDHGRAGLRRRLGLDHGRHAAQHRRRGDGRHSRPAQGAPAQPGPGLRGRRRLHEVLVPGRGGQARPVRAGRRGVDPQREDQEGRLLGRARDRPSHRPADHDLRVDRPPRARRRGPWWPPAPAPPTAASTPCRATRPAAWACPTTWAGSGNRRPACRSSACRAARCSRTTSWRRCSICSIRRPAWPR